MLNVNPTRSEREMYDSKAPNHLWGEEEDEMNSEEKHLCDDCRYDFPTCDAEKIIFGIDRDPSARGKEADKILQCDRYSSELTALRDTEGTEEAGSEDNA